MIEKFFALAFAFISSVMTAMGYGGIILLMGIESACIPLPSELIMPLAGYLASQGVFNLYWAATAGAIGCNLGSIPAYELGRYGGRPLIERYGKYILLNKKDMEHAEHFFLRYGSLAIFIGRLLPVIRTFIALPAGLAKMPRVRFHVYTFVGSWPWCFGLAWLGMKIGQNWQSTLKPYFLQFKEVIIAVLLLAVVWFVWTHWKNRVTQRDVELAEAEEAEKSSIRS